MRYLGSTEHFAPGKKTALQPPRKKAALQRLGKKSEGPEKNRGAKRAREVGQTVLSLGHEAPRTKRPRSSHSKSGARSATKKTGCAAEGKNRAHRGKFFIYSGAKTCCAPNQNTGISPLMDKIGL